MRGAVRERPMLPPVTRLRPRDLKWHDGAALAPRSPAEFLEFLLTGPGPRPRRFDDTLVVISLARPRTRPAPSGVAVSPARPTRKIGRRRRCPCRSQADLAALERAEAQRDRCPARWSHLHAMQSRRPWLAHGRRFPSGLPLAGSQPATTGHIDSSGRASSCCPCSASAHTHRHTMRRTRHRRPAGQQTRHSSNNRGDHCGRRNFD